MTWTIDSAWRKGADDTLTAARLYSVANASAAPGSGTLRGAATWTTTSDLSNPLFDLSYESNVFDLSSAANGTYDLFATNCCRVGGVMNTNSQSAFSQWVRFTKTGAGTYNLPPVFNRPSLYLIIDPAVTTTADFSAVDPENTAVTYSSITTTSSPYYGGTTLPCSSITSGVLRLSSSLCSGSDVFSNIYQAGTYWTAKVQATDADGNFAVVDTLFRVISTPAPVITGSTAVGNHTTYEFATAAPDTNVDTYTVMCTSTTNAQDVLTGTASSSPVTIPGFTPGSSYRCDVTAVNSAGTGVNHQQYAVGPVVLEGLSLGLDLTAGQSLSGAVAHLFGGNLQPNSAFQLTLEGGGVVLNQGLADSSGNFNVDVTLTQQACPAGVHRLVLSGLSRSATTLTDTVWVELNSSCSVIRSSRTEITEAPQLAMTGFSATPYLALGSGFVFLGLLLILAKRRRNSN